MKKISSKTKMENGKKFEQNFLIKLEQLLELGGAK
jgi:hypothetical protein